jgi:hypothetical protein
MLAAGAAICLNQRVDTSNKIDQFLQYLDTPIAPKNARDAPAVLLWLVAVLAARTVKILSIPFLFGAGCAYLAFSSGRFIFGSLFVFLTYRYGKWLFGSAGDCLSSLF